MANDDLTSLAVAEFVATSCWDDVPDDVRRIAKRAVLNILGTAFDGCRQDGIELALQSLLDNATGTGTIIGRPETVDMLAASFLNAASANIADFDDTHMPTIIHPTAPVAAALLALAESRPIDGRTFLLALVVGTEIACRAGLALSPSHYRRGWHITATAGVVGAAAAAARALGLDASGTLSAISAAATQACGIVECLGTMSKILGVGNAARNGLWAGLLAQRGLTGPRMPLEGRQGFLHVMSQDGDPRLITDELGSRWETLANTFKPYPCGVVINPVIDACRDLRSDASFRIEDVRQIIVTGNPLLGQRADRPNVVTGRESQVSLQHCGAATLLFGTFGPPQITDECVSDPAVLALRERVTFVDDRSIPIEAVRVALVFGNDERREVFVPHARGSLGRPMSDAEIDEKFRLLVPDWMPADHLQELVDSVWHLEVQPDVAAVLRLTRPPAGQVS